MNLFVNGSVQFRFMARVNTGGPNGCWLWTGALSEDGYGRFSVTPHERARSHRWSYEHFVGPIPDGLQLDHLCRNRSCVNPAHLEPVTNHENMMRGEGIGALHARKTHCIHGHEFTEENTGVRLRPGMTERVCLTCVRNRRRRKAAA